MSTKNMPTTTAVEVATEEQLGHILDQQKRRIRARGLTKDEANVIIRNGNRYLPVMDRAADVLIDRVRSEIANTIVRSFKIDPTRTPQAALDATGRKQYVNSDVVATMPTDGLTEGEMIFFKPDPSSYKDGYISDDALAKEYDSRGLKPHPLAQASINEADPAFADNTPNGCHWKRTDGGYNFLTFNHWIDERVVFCNRRDDVWYVDWSFGGVRK